MKKKFIYFSLLCSIIASNMYLTSCNKSNGSESSSSQNLTSETSNDSSSSSLSSTEENINIEETFNLLMEKRNFLSNITNYEKGFTSTVSSESNSDVCVLDDKTNYGELNADGNKWTSENEKEETKNAILENYSNYYNYSNNYLNKVAFDLENEEGFQTYNEDYNNAPYYSYNYLYTKENNDYFSYNIDELERYIIGKDYYKEIFSEHLYLLNEIDLYEDYNSLTLFIDYLKVYYEEEYESINVSLDVAKENEDNSYILTLTIDYINTVGNELYGYSSSSGKEIIKYSFNDNYLKVSYTSETKYEYINNINDSNDSGYVVIQIAQNSSTNYLFLAEYNNDNCPTVDDIKENFEDKGYVSINVNYYIDGHYIFNSSSSPSYNDDVKQLSLYGYNDCFRSDMVWYLDSECTIPFNENTWPCYSLNLYTTLDSLNDDYYFVAHYSFTEEEYNKALEQNESHYYFDIMKKGEGSDFIDFIYAYFNDEIIYSKDEIIFVEGKINYLILIVEE